MGKNINSLLEDKYNSIKILCLVLVVIIEMKF